MLNIISKCVDVEEMDDKFWNKRCVGDFSIKLSRCVF